MTVATAAGGRELTWADVPRAAIWAALGEALRALGAEAGRKGAAEPGRPGREGAAEPGRPGRAGAGLAGAPSRGGPPAVLSVVDAGGGSGGFAVPLAAAGHRVLVIDPNADALAALARRAAEGGVADRVSARQADLVDLPTLVRPGSVDLLLCHDVLEHVESPTAALAALISTLRPGGLLSVVAANRAGPVLARALAGRFGEAEHALADPFGRTGPADTPRRFDLAELTALVEACGAEVIAARGARIVTDLLPAAGRSAAGPGGPAALARLERALAEIPEYRAVAAAVHILARRGAADAR